MRNNIGFCLCAAILFLLLIGLAEILNSGTKGLTKQSFSAKLHLSIVYRAYFPVECSGIGAVLI